MSQTPPHIPTNLISKKSSSSSLPEFILTALSLFIVVSPPKPRSPIPISFPFYPRRFFKISTMSLPTNPRNPNFPSPQSLSDWLKTRLPSDSFATWGVKPGTKNVHSLWLELAEGETSLADSFPPIRTLDVVIVRIRGDSVNSGKTLIESHQELSDGSVRGRFRPLSEKMKPNETVESAVYRAIKEELGSVIGEQLEKDCNFIEIVPNSYAKKVEERVSVSYPGLPAIYVLHSVEARVKGLPNDEFSTEEGAEYEEIEENRVADMAVSCRKHFWKWVDSDSV